MAVDLNAFTLVLVSGPAQARSEPDRVLGHTWLLAGIHHHTTPDAAAHRERHPILGVAIPYVERCELWAIGMRSGAQRDRDLIGREGGECVMLFV
jgi:hypothetical protein